MKPACLWLAFFQMASRGRLVNSLLIYQVRRKFLMSLRSQSPSPIQHDVHLPKWFIEKQWYTQGWFGVWAPCDGPVMTSATCLPQPRLQTEGPYHCGSDPKPPPCHIGYLYMIVYDSIDGMLVQTLRQRKWIISFISLLSIYAHCSSSS